MESWASALFSAVRKAALRIRARRRDAVERRRGYKRALLDRVAERLGIQRIEASDEIGDSLAGWVDGFYVEIHTGPFASRKPVIDRVRIELDGEGSIPSGIAIEPKVLWDPEFGRELLPRRPKAPEDRPIGILSEVTLPDDTFNATVLLSGDPLTVCALLDARTREAIVETVRDNGVWVSAGSMVWQARHAAASAEPIVEMASRMLYLAQRLVIKPEEIAVRLVSIARDDPSAGMRKEALNRLIVHFPVAVETGVACRTALDDRDAFVRIQAAKHLGEEGIATLKKIIQLEQENDQARVSALQHLAKNHPRAAASVLAKLLSSSSPRVVFATLDALLHLEAGLVRATDVEARLVELADAGERAMKERAIDLLARVGTGRALAALHALARGVFGDAAIREAARAAIQAIEARLGQAEGGRLSLVEANGVTGALSVASEEGSVSVAAKGPEEM